MKPGWDITFQVFASAGVAVGSGPSTVCVIPGGSSSATNDSTSITLVGPALYAVKATSLTEKLPDRMAAWALGN